MTSSELLLAIKKRPQDITFERCMICMTAAYFMQMTPFMQSGVFKVLSSFFMVASEFFAISTIVILYKRHYMRFSRTQWFFIASLLIYNLYLMLTGIISPDCVMFTFWGNKDFQPAFFLSFFILIGADVLLFRVLYKYIRIYSLSVVMCIPFGLGILVNYGILLFFLIAFAIYCDRKTLYILFAAGLVCFVACMIEDARTPAIRLVGAFVIYIFSLCHQKIKPLFKKIIMVVVMTLPLYFFVVFVTTGVSVFNEMGEKGSDHRTDTRTFLYEEVILDLVQNDAVVWGKGINGRYYSSYFSSIEGDSDDRINPEVGFLSMLLHGGVVLCALSIVVLAMAVYLSFVKSKMLFVNIIGALLLMHFVLLFIEHIPQYGMLYILFQFMIGMAFASKHLDLNMQQTNLLFKGV